MRIFAALPVPLQAAADLAAAIEPVRLAYPRLRWVPPSAYHLTVHFFGDLPDPAVDALKALFLDPALLVPAIPARFGLLGQFPGQGHARVIHASLERGAEEARGFHDVFHRLAGPLGYQPEARGFSPHITLARVPSGAPARPPAPGWETGIDLPRDGFVISECVLFQSVLSPVGARYIPLAAAPFGVPVPGEGRAK